MYQFDYKKYHIYIYTYTYLLVWIVRICELNQKSLKREKIGKIVALLKNEPHHVVRHPRISRSTYFKVVVVAASFELLAANH